MTIGIYKLKFIGTDKVYIGKSINIEQRFKNHLNSFKTGKASAKLNEAYIKYGNPTLETIEEGTPEILSNKETEYITKYDAVNSGFNTLYESEDIPLLYGENHPNSKYSNAQIVKVFNLLVDSQENSFKEIRDLTDVSLGVIGQISGLILHTWLKDMYPEKYKILQSLNGKRHTSVSKGIVFPLIESPEGKAYRVGNITEFAKTHGLHKGNLHHVLTGKRKMHKGWRLCT